MSSIDRDLLRAIVLGAPIDAVRDFAATFVPYDEPGAEPDNDDAWREFAFDVLQSGIGDSDSGCPQTVDDIRALFEGGAP